MKNGDFTASDFASLDHPSVAKLARLGRLNRFAPHTIVVIEGDFSDCAYLILEGRVKAFVSEPDGARSCCVCWGRATVLERWRLTAGLVWRR